VEENQQMPGAAETPDLKRLAQEAAEAAIRRLREEEAGRERERQAQSEDRVRDLEGRLREVEARAEAAEKREMIRETLRKSGVQNVELAYRAIRDDVAKNAEGKWVARDGNGELAVTEYVRQFLEANPELLPARIAGGSGSSGMRTGEGGGGFDLNSIRPGMDPAELSRVRSEVARLISLSSQR
jgi:hypothetical protein